MIPAAVPRTVKRVWLGGWLAGLVFAGALFTGGPASAASACTWTGVWSSTGGDIHFTSEGSGWYNVESQTLEGRVAASVLTGIWRNGDGVGELNSGWFRFAMSEDCKKFTGTWSYAAAPNDVFTWKGRRTEPPPAGAPATDSPRVATCREPLALPAATSTTSRTQVKFSFKSVGQPFRGPKKLPLAGRGSGQVVAMKLEGAGRVPDIGVVPPENCLTWDSGKDFVEATGNLRMEVSLRTAFDRRGSRARIEKVTARLAVTGARFVASGDYRLLELRVRVVKGIGRCVAGSKGIIKIDRSPFSEESISSLVKHRACKFKFAFEKIGEKGKSQQVKVSQPRVI